MTSLDSRFANDGRKATCKTWHLETPPQDQRRFQALALAVMIRHGPPPPGEAFAKPRINIYTEYEAAEDGEPEEGFTGCL